MKEEEGDTLLRNEIHIEIYETYYPYYISDCHREYGHYAEEGLRSQLHGDETVLLCLPVGGGGRLQTGAVVLCYDASDCVLKRFCETGELLDARFDDLLAPLVHFLLLVDDIVGADHLLDGLLSDLLDLLRVEVLIIIEVVHFIQAASLFYLI